MILNANATNIPLKDKSIQCAITSPPYWGLRDYGTAMWVGGDPNCNHNPQRKDGGARADRSLPLGRGGLFKKVCLICGAIREDAQLGLEATPELYVANMVKVFREVWRVLKDDGVLWLNLGDSYAANQKGSGGQSDKQDSNAGSRYDDRKFDLQKANLKPKDLVGIPWMVAFALRADGWYLRQDIIWYKRNPMPESVTDRCTKAHEYIFLLTKSARYYYDHEAIKESASLKSLERRENKSGRVLSSKQNNAPDKFVKPDFMSASDGKERWPDKRNKRSVWDVTTKPYKGAHFATFPPDLVEPMVLAGSREGDVVFDPFSGTSTVGQVAHKHKRKYAGTELSLDYIRLAQKRLRAVDVVLF